MGKASRTQCGGSPRESLVECAGLWSGIPEDEYKAIRNGRSEARAALNEAVRRRVEAS